MHLILSVRDPDEQEWRVFQLNVENLHRLLNTGIITSNRTPVTSFTHDSRSVSDGAAFVALPGSKSHGAEFIADAFRNGAACVITDDTQISRSAPVWTDKVLRVPDAATALSQIAHWNRQQSDADLWAITGSVGKTTTRQMLFAVFSASATGLQSPRNFNNELGVPLSLTMLSDCHTFATLELAAKRPGDIRQLCELSQPCAGIITRVAPCHLQSFGTLQQISATKQELAESIPADGDLLLNADDPLVRPMSAATSARVHWFGCRAAPEHRMRLLSAEPEYCTISCGDDRFRLRAPRHLAPSAAAAIVAGRLRGLSAHAIREGLEQFQPDVGRGQVIRSNGLAIIDESYNSSPASVAASIASLQDWSPSRLILVAGEMRELGKDSAMLHQQQLEILLSARPDQLWLVGPLAAEQSAMAIRSGFPRQQLHAFTQVEEVMARLPATLRCEDVVWIKGSRSLQLEQLIPAIIEQQSMTAKDAA